jgi:serine acetyltransferase
MSSHNTAIDWAALRSAATAAMGNAYVPYSTFPVGAAALVTRDVPDGITVKGSPARAIPGRLRLPETPWGGENW